MIFHSFDKTDQFIIPNLVTAGIILVILFWIAVNNSETSKDSKRHTLSQMLLLVSFMGSIFTIL